MSPKDDSRSDDPRKAAPKEGWGEMLDSLRQWMQPQEWRIAAPPRTRAQAGPEPEAPTAEPTGATGSREDDAMVASLATCLWYLKTKHFKRAWSDLESDDDDPRVRRSLGRINRVIDSLAKGQVELHDPTNERYPAGGQNMMRPIQFTPTAGMTFEMVTETVVPVIYRSERMIQVGEVFVATPIDPDEAAPPASAPEPVTDQDAETPSPEQNPND